MIGNFRFGLKREKLLQLCLKVKGSGSCFVALSQIEQALFDLTTKVVDEVYTLKLKQVGFPQARKLSLYTQKGRNVFARNCAYAVRLPRFSGVMYINDLRSAGLTEFRS